MKHHHILWNWRSAAIGMGLLLSACTSMRARQAGDAQTFERVIAQEEPKTYAVVISSKSNWGVSTGFMIAPGIVVTAGHAMQDLRGKTIQVISVPGILKGEPFRDAELVAADYSMDIALLKVSNPISTECVRLATLPIPIGTTCGTITFSYAKAELKPRGGYAFNLIRRAQAVTVASYYTGINEHGDGYQVYETGNIMYPGSSGAPGFLMNGTVFGMHVKTWRPWVEEDNIGNPGFSLWISSEEIIRFAELHKVARWQ